MKPEAPKFIVVYQDNPNGYCYSLRNSKNEYASLMMDNGPIKRVWRTAAEAELYITKWAASDLVWVAYTERVPPIKHVGTAATYDPAEHMRQRWAEQLAQQRRRRTASGLACHPTSG